MLVFLLALMSDEAEQAATSESDPDPAGGRNSVFWDRESVKDLAIPSNGETMRGQEEGIMILSTTPSIDGKKAVKYLGLVSGDAILGANIFRDFFASIRDIVGGRSAAYEAELRKAKDIALGEMREQARHLGANAIVGIDIDYETIGASSSMLMVSASGTAVVLELE